jgi:hypothetical protein
MAVLMFTTCTGAAAFKSHELRHTHHHNILRRDVPEAGTSGQIIKKGFRTIGYYVE